MHPHAGSISTITTFLPLSSLPLCLSFFFPTVRRPHVQPTTSVYRQLRLTVQSTDFNNNVKFTSLERSRKTNYTRYERNSRRRARQRVCNVCGFAGAAARDYLPRARARDVVVIRRERHHKFVLCVCAVPGILHIFAG